MRRTTVLVVALAAVLALSACNPSRSGYRGPAGAPRLTVLGHSIPTSARPELGDVLARTRLVAFDTENGRTIPQASSSIDWAVGEAPGVVVVDLGENELGTGQSQEQLRQGARATLDRLAGIPCVVWVDIRDRATSFYRADWQIQAESFNAWLPAEAAGRANTHVAGWADWARLHQDWFLGDSLHLNPVGRTAYADFVAAEVDRLCGGPVASAPNPVGPTVARTAS
jgi:hypothetical protein